MNSSLAVWVSVVRLNWFKLLYKESWVISLSSNLCEYDLLFALSIWWILIWCQATLHIIILQVQVLLMIKIIYIYKAITPNLNTPAPHSHLRPCNTNESHDTGERKWLLGPIWTFSLRGVLTFVASGLDINGCVLSYFEGQQIYTVIQAVHSLLLHCSKVSFSSVLSHEKI